MPRSEHTGTTVRPRLTSAPRAGLAHTTVTLLDGIPGAGTAFDELVVLGAAAGVVVGAAERITDPVLAIAGHGGPAACAIDLAGNRTVAELKRQVRDALATGTEIDPLGAVVVGSARMESDRGSGTPAIELELRGEPGGARALRVTVDTSVVEPWFGAVFARAVAAALSAFDRPDRAAAELPFADPADVAATAAMSIAGLAPPAEPVTLVGPIIAAAERAPDQVAVVSEDACLTYAELLDAAARVAADLARHGVGDGDRVAVLTGRSATSIAAILGTLLAGAAYVPLDPQSPPDRLAVILADAACRAVLVSPGSQLPDGEGGTRIVLTDALTRGTTDVRRTAGPAVDQTAYVIYTSGSTGRPKGVTVRHAAIASFLSWRVGYYGLDHRTRLLLLPSLAFDSSIGDLFSVLWAGGTLVLADVSPPDPRRLAALVEQHDITQFTAVPSLYRLLVEELADSGPAALRAVTIAGEATTAELAARHRELLPSVSLVNEYGPTENSVAASAFRYGADDGPGCPIGRPISNTAVTVAGHAGRPLPAGFVGELRLTGPGLADGYLNAPELTAEAFTTDGDVPGGRCYRTGDLGWWRQDGMLEFAGRADDQVKIRGHRVELGEVERALTAVPGVASAAVAVTNDHDGLLALVGFVEGDGVEERAVRVALTDLLPPAMLPSRVVVLAALPRLVSGKPDRQRLAELASTPPEAGAPEPDGSADAVVATVAEVFGEVLAVERVEPDDDFFALGGHSLSAVTVIRKLEERLGVLVDLDGFLDAATVRQVAAEVRRSPAAGGDPAVPAVPSLGDSTNALARFLP